ncbi:DUF4097 domain-containing protein [Marinoscillum pacificum]|uniref:DUF4097 domain-containing protein n=1 Tax=Marinoscillum pacificum TaxID=392723 RepID=UPI002157F6B2|nr:DUF4097 domain-containing protein [Marinoscillum pacificum]
MKKLAILLFGIFIAATAVAQDEGFSEQFTIPLTKPGERAYIKLDQVQGDIKVTAYDGKEVIIIAKSSGKNLNNHRQKDDNIPAGMKKVSSTGIELRAKENNNKIDIDSESWKARIDIEMKVPANCDLDLHTVHGIIEVTGVNGAMDLSGVNGGINLSNVSGSIVSNTVNGEVKVTLQKITSGEPMSFVTLNGNVDVTLPASTKATTKMKSDQGDIYTDFDMDMERSKTNVKRDDGKYEVSINQWVYGKINGGGPEYTMKNMNGNIIVRKGK